VIVRWRAPAKLPGIRVTDYVIRYWDGTTRSKLITVRDGRSTDTRLVMRQLDKRSDGKYHDYRVQIAAKNTFVSGAASDRVRVER
jgi:hypothetical protein